MLIVKQITDLQKIISNQKKTGLVGFVPTMGALHAGHISLIKKSKSTCSYTVCSIFVNPTQFNDPNDLLKYPKPIELDIELLEASGCDLLFLPDVSEVYPEGSTKKRNFDFGNIDKVMEGFFRPGHFDGMAQVVDRLLDIVQPDKLFMGQKDFQQLTIVRAMLKITSRQTELVICPTLRESDGLAMSSRNVRLTKELRLQASIIYKTLTWAKRNARHKKFDALCEKAYNKLSLPFFKPEYFELVDGFTLERLNNYDDSNFIIACVACWVGEVRLIDNIIIKNEKV